MPKFKYNDTTISYETIGTGLPIIMLHGWGLNRKMMFGCMEPVFSQIDYQFRRIYLDLPGRGESHAGADIKNSDDMIRVLLSFIESVLPENESFILAGESYGGYLARGIIKEMPNRVSGLILLCPLVIPGFRQGRVVPLQVMEQDEQFLSTLNENERSSFEYMNVILTKEVWERYCNDICCAFPEQDTYFLNNVLDGACTYDTIFTYPVENDAKHKVQNFIMI